MDYSQKQKEKVMTQLTTIDTNNYAAMAKAMGIAHEKTSSISLVRWHGYASTTHLSWVRQKLMARSEL